MTSEQKIAIITTGYLNTVDDALPGQPVSSGTGDPQYKGQLGATLAFTHEAAGKASYTNTLYGGTYQYVLSYASSSGSPARGLVAFWHDEDDYIATPDADAGTAKIAGIYLNSVTKGRYCWIQTGGLATVKFRAAITKATPAIGDLVLCQATTNVGEVIDDATAILPTTLRSVLGVAKEAPTNGGYKLVELWERFKNV